MSSQSLLDGPRRHPGGPEALEGQPGQLPEGAGDVHPRHALSIVIDEVRVVERLRRPGRGVGGPRDGLRAEAAARPARARPRAPRAASRPPPRGRSGRPGTRRPRAAPPPPRRAPGSRTLPAAGASSRWRASRRPAGRRSSVTISSGALPRYSMPSSRKSPDDRDPPLAARADQGHLGAERPQDRRRVGRGDGPAARAPRRHQADVAVLLHAEADRPAPLVGLVVVVAARVDADVAAERPHVAELRRRDHAGRPRQRRVVRGDLGMLRDARQRRAGAHHQAVPRARPGSRPAPGCRGGPTSTRGSICRRFMFG